MDEKWWSLTADNAKLKMDDGTFKHLVRNLNVRPDSSLWHNRDNSVLLGSCESKQGQGRKLGHSGMWKIPWNAVIFIRKQYHLIIMRDQNPPPPMTDMLNGLTTRHPLGQYVEPGNYINIIFMRERNPPPPMTNMLNGLSTSTLSSWGIKIRHLLLTICWLGKWHQLCLHEGSKLATPSEQYVDCGTSTPGKHPGCSEHL